MKLTKTLKETIARDMAQSFYPPEAQQEIADNLSAFARGVAEASIPKEVLACFNKSPGYFRTDNDVKFANSNGSVYGTDSVTVYFSGGNLPCDGSYFSFPENVEATRLWELRKKMQEAFHALYTKIISVLNSCTTTKQLEEVLPEAVPFIPKESAGMLVPVEAYQSLRRELALMAQENKESK